MRPGRRELPYAAVACGPRGPVLLGGVSSHPRAEGTEAFIQQDLFVVVEGCPRTSQPVLCTGHAGTLSRVRCVCSRKPGDTGRGEGGGTVDGAQQHLLLDARAGDQGIIRRHMIG